MIFLLILIALGGLAMHAMLTSAVKNYEYGSSPRNEWVRFETEKGGGRYYPHL